MRRLRVLHLGKFYPPHTGGIESHLRDLCGELQKVADVTVLAASDDRRSTETLEGGVRVRRVRSLFNVASAPFCPGMVQLIQSSQADIVHIHLPNPGAVMAYLVSRHKGPLVVTFHSDVVRQELLRIAFEPILSRVLNRCAIVIAASQKYVETSPVLAAYRDRCRVVPFGIPIGNFRTCNGAEVSKIRDRYGPRILLTVGRLVYYKGLEYLIDAMSMVRGKLLIVGQGPLRSTLEHRVQQRGLSDCVVFLGPVKDLIPYYHAADLFVLASVARSEAFGIVQLEAMACGKPVVNTNLPSGVPFVSLHGITGITVPPANPEALANAMNLLLDDPVRRRQYGDAARRRVELEFNLELMARRTLQLYCEALQSHIPRAESTEYGLTGLPKELGIADSSQVDPALHTTVK